MMRASHFDPFGEPMRDIGQNPSLDRSRVSTFALRLGVGVFWGLVIGIVTARVIYFDPDFAHSFGVIAATCLQGLTNG